MNLRTITCDITSCAAKHTEATPGDGFPGWGQLNGIVLNKAENPCLCPEHLAAIATFVDELGGSV